MPSLVVMVYRAAHALSLALSTPRLTIPSPCLPVLHSPQVSISSAIHTGGAEATLVISGRLVGMGALSGAQLMPAASVGAGACVIGVLQSAGVAT